MNGSRISDQNTKARLAAQFNEFYLQVTSPEIKQIGNYRIIEEIGEGAFGKVYLANHVLLNVHVVLKCGLIDDPNIVREVYYHRQLRHKNIVKLYEVIRSEKHLWMALEYCEGSELFYYIYEKRRLEYREGQNLFYQILTGVNYVHSLNLSHRDLKLENILLSDTKKTTVKLTDFGFVREFNPLKRQFLSTVCGTTVYMAPELIKNETYSGFAIDIWSLGVILFTMLYGEMPFDEDDDLKTKYKIVNEEPLYRNSIPQEAIDILQKMLSKDPRSRPSINDILKSSFLVDVTNTCTEKSNRSSFHNDQESIISISQHYNSGIQPFQSKIDRNLIRRFEKLNIDISQLQQDVINGEINTLTAFYELSLVREFKKKKKHYREKKRKYREAKKSLLNSRKKVKSALSLSEQGSTSQPLERIISSLSLSSNRNSMSRTNLSKVGSRKSIEFNEPFKKPRGSILNRNSLNEQRMNKLITNIDHDHSNSSVVEVNVNNVGTSLARTVSFNPEEVRRRPSNATTTLSSMAGSESLSKKSKNTKILDKLQFWKKTKNLNGDTGKTNISKKNEMHYHSSLPLVGDNYSPSPKTLVNRDKKNILVIETQDSTLVNDNLILNADNKSGIEHKDEIINSIDNNSNDIVLDSPNQATPTLDGFPSSPKYLKTRPSSMVSQVSQVSHLSQLSTMMSESDILGETDTMDEEDYDEDGVYESSFDNSQQDFPQRHLSATNTKLSNIKKRPSYRRTLSSDVSIMSTSTTATGSNQPSGKLHHQRKSLSRLSSNSSDDSSIQHKNTNNIDEQLIISPTPALAPSGANKIISPAANKPKSPEVNQHHRIPLINSKIWRHNHTPLSKNAATNASKPDTLVQTFQLPADNEAFTRSNSPPLPSKFNKLKLKNGSTKNYVSQMYGSKFSTNTPWPSKMNKEKEDICELDNKDKQLEMDNSQYNKDNYPNKTQPNNLMNQTYFIINEEEEDEY